MTTPIALSRQEVEPAQTEVFPNGVKPVRVGWYEHIGFDAGWTYEWRIWWDGTEWREQPGGRRLTFQDYSWRGLTEEACTPQN